MYEGCLQHDAQEVLQCILGHIQETCQLLKEAFLNEPPTPLDDFSIQLGKRSRENGDSAVIEKDGTLLVGQVIEDCEDKSKGNGKRKSDMEDGNEKKKSKVSEEKNRVEDRQRQTRSKRKAAAAAEEKLENKLEATAKYSTENESTKPTQKKSRLRLNWLKSSSNQPSILSKFCSLGKLTTNLGFKEHFQEIGTYENGNEAGQERVSLSVESTSEREPEKPHKRGWSCKSFWKGVEGKDPTCGSADSGERFSHRAALWQGRDLLVPGQGWTKGRSTRPQASRLIDLFTTHLEAKELLGIALALGLCVDFYCLRFLGFDVGISDL